MPSKFHEFLVELFRNAPRLVADLAAFHPTKRFSKGEWEEANVDLTETLPQCRWADVLFRFVDKRKKNRRVVILEIQLNRDGKKRRAWWSYLISAWTKFDCDVMLVVFAPDPKIAEWCRKPITTGHPDCHLTPVVVDRNDLKSFRKPLKPTDIPEWAVLYALAHSHTELAVEAATEALDRIAHLAEEQRVRYADIILAVQTKDALSQLELTMEKQKFHSKIAKHWVAVGVKEGRQEGRQEGRLEELQPFRRALLRLIEVICGPVSPPVAQAITEEESGQTLEKLQIALLSAGTVDEARTILAQFTSRVAN